MWVLLLPESDSAIESPGCDLAFAPRQCGWTAATPRAGVAVIVAEKMWMLCEKQPLVEQMQKPTIDPPPRLALVR